jgi:4-hydroxy-3-methylbut-2-enyl diphosphate reductase IspH
VRQAFLLCIPRSTLNLVIVIVQANNIDARKLDNLASRAAHTASHIENTHVIAQAHLVRKVVFMTGNGLIERFTVSKAAKMEALAPAVLVEVGCEVIVMSGQSSILIPPSLELVST